MGRRLKLPDTWPSLLREALLAVAFWGWVALLSLGGLGVLVALLSVLWRWWWSLRMDALLQISVAAVVMGLGWAGAFALLALLWPQPPNRRG